MSPQTRTAIPALEGLRLPELQARYLEVVGTETRCPNRQYLIRRISEALLTPPEAHESLAEGANSPNSTTADTEGLETVGVLEQDEDLPTKTLDNNEVPGDANPDDVDTNDCDTDGVETLDEQELVPLESADGTAAEVPATDDVGGDAREQSVESTMRKRGRFSGMSIEQLQSMYHNVIGRSTTSTHPGYMIWKIREAEKGRVRVGPVERHRVAESAETVKVLPLRLESEMLGRIDTAWRTHGMRSRMEFFRLAVGNYLEQLGVS